MFAVLRKAWNDSVWSKVIASGIVGALAAGAGALATHWDAVRDALARPVQAPLWVVLLLGVGVALLLTVAWLGRREREADGPAEMDVQPNAIAVAPLEGEIDTKRALPLKRIPLLELRTMAVAHGWPAQLKDARWPTFLRELRQAALDDAVAMFGRRMKKPSGHVLYGKKDPLEPLLEIDRRHWETSEVEPPTFLSTEVDADPRSYDKSESDWGMSAGRYRDLHVGRGAVEWLRTTTVPPP